MKKGIIAASIVALLLTLTFIYWLPSPTYAPAAAIPTPNGYTELAEAGRLVGQIPDEIDQAEADVLAEFLDANREALPRIKEALQHKSSVPVEYSAGFTSQETSRINAIRQAARLLMADARLAEQQGRMADAAKTNLDLIALGQKRATGGLLVHFQVGAAYERYAWNALLRIASSLSADERRQFLSELESLDYHREPMEVYAKRERKLSNVENGWLVTFVTSRQANQVYDRCTQIIEEIKQLKTNVTEAMSAE